MAAATEVSEVWKREVVGAWVCGTVFRGICGSALDEALPVPGLWRGPYTATESFLEKVPTSGSNHHPELEGENFRESMAWANQPSSAAVLVAWIQETMRSRRKDRQTGGRGPGSVA